MPISSTVWADFSSGDVLTASDITSRFQELQRFVNGGIKTSDVKTSATWVESQHIFKPEFYGSPSPRFEAVSGDVYYKHRQANKLNRYYRHEHSGSLVQPSGSYSGGGSDAAVWHPIEGMSSTIHVTEATVTAIAVGTFYAWESGGEIPVREHAVPVDLSNERGFFAAQNAGKVCAEFKLFVDTDDGAGPQPVGSTLRRIYQRAGGRYNCRRMQHSFLWTGTLTRGVNKLSYRSWYRLLAEDDESARHVYVDARNFIVDVHYK